MESEEQIRNAFPEIQQIEDAELREKVQETWEMALSEGNYDDINEIPWWPPHTDVVGDQRQVDHLRDVLAMSIAITDELEDRREFTIDRDTVVAGAVLHDISKLFEFPISDENQLVEWLPHPLYAMYILEEFGFSHHMKHLVMAHSHRSSITPKTLEAKIVQLADVMASNAIFWESTGSLYDKAN